MTEGHIQIAPPRRTLFAVLAGGVVAATAILCGAVLPAEYHIDPLGIGQATGLLKLSRAEETQIALPVSEKASTVAQSYAVAYRTDSIEIPLAAGGDENREDDLEWKVRMKAGDAVVYSWSVEAPAEEFYSDFHGETDPTPDVKIMSYKKGVGTASNGWMVAQFDGIHGWYLQNQSEKPVVVRLKLSGFYELLPDPYAAKGPSSAE